MSFRRPDGQASSDNPFDSGFSIKIVIDVTISLRIFADRQVGKRATSNQSTPFAKEGKCMF